MNRLLNKMRGIGRFARAGLAKKWPVYVFHHIPKCGGSSLLEVLDSWFFIVRDYRTGWTKQYPKPVFLKRLRSSHCLCGHWELDGFHLNQRYPEVLASDTYRLLTFIRDPLDVQLSLFSYEKNNGVNKAQTLEEHLLLRPNYLASIFPLTRENYKEILDKYFFIGILEHAQESVDCLADLLQRPKVTIPTLNQSGRKKNEKVALPSELVRKFRNNNELDYLIYEYCLSRYRRMSNNA